MARENLYRDDLLAQLNEADRPATARKLHWLTWMPVFVAVFALLALLGWGLARQQGSAGGVATNEGPFRVETLQKPASDFEGALYDPFRGQDEVRLSDLRGEVVVVNFWASWCPPCREEAPVLEQTWRAYKDRGVVFLGVDIWDTEWDARAYMAEFDITYPNLIDERGRIAVEYGLTGVPETYFITPDGMVSRRVIGAISRSALEQNIQEAMASGIDSEDTAQGATD